MIKQHFQAFSSSETGLELQMILDIWKEGSLFSHPEKRGELLLRQVSQDIAYSIHASGLDTCYYKNYFVQIRDNNLFLSREDAINQRTNSHGSSYGHMFCSLLLIPLSLYSV